MERKRYNLLDGIRGLAILNMVAYHAIWDLVYLYGVKWDWYQSEGAYVWQQGICWTFILVSGFCYPFGRRKIKRGLMILGLGFVISMVTWIATPQARVRFGVLTLIGSCMLLMVPLERHLKKAGAAAGLLMSAALFFLTRNVNRGFLGFEKWNFLKLPGKWYDNWISTYLGFPERILFVRLFFPDSLVLFISDRIFCQQTVISEKAAFVFENGEEQNIGNTGTIFPANLCIASTPVIWRGFAPQRIDIKWKNCKY